MLYYLSYLSADISVLNLFKYLSFRAGGALVVAFLIMLLFGPRFISWLKSKQANGQPIRQNGPVTHLLKQGTPCMGGLLIIIAILSSTILFARLNNPYILIMLFVMLAFGVLGAVDDYKKLTRHSVKGISGKQKIMVQGGISLLVAFAFICVQSGQVGTMISMPFIKDFIIDLSWFYIPFAIILLVGTSNAVNLTDGLDGLVSLPVIMCALVFMVFAYVIGRVDYASYVQLGYMPGVGELVVFCGGVIGAVLGFLWFNAHPAKVFMGDTGSLALGGILGALSMATKQELLLVIAGGVFVAEAVSDIIQVGYYKITKKRVFLMAPIHHHFEKKGWSETVVVVRFWIVSILLAIVALASLKIR